MADSTQTYSLKLSGRRHLARQVGLPVFLASHVLHSQGCGNSASPSLNSELSPGAHSTVSSSNNFWSPSRNGLSVHSASSSSSTSAMAFSRFSLLRAIRCARLKPPS